MRIQAIVRQQIMMQQQAMAMQQQRRHHQQLRPQMQPQMQMQMQHVQQTQARTPLAPVPCPRRTPAGPSLTVRMLPFSRPVGGCIRWSVPCHAAPCAPRLQAPQQQAPQPAKPAHLLGISVGVTRKRKAVHDPLVRTCPSRAYVHMRTCHALTL